MINNFEVKLASNLTLAVSLTDAEKFHRDHEDIKPFVDVRYGSFFVSIDSFLICCRESANVLIIFNVKPKNYPQLFPVRIHHQVRVN